MYMYMHLYIYICMHRYVRGPSWSSQVIVSLASNCLGALISERFLKAAICLGTVSLVPRFLITKKHAYTSIYIYIYTYTYIERERDRENVCRYYIEFITLAVYTYLGHNYG